MLKKKILKNKSLEDIDVLPRSKNDSWLYSDKVKKHFFHPKNFVQGEFKKKYDGLGLIGSPACGDMMKIWIKVDKKNDTIKSCQWQTFGCASAIAATSIMSEMVKNMKLDQALKITPQDIVKEMEGLPLRKIHCSVLGDKALVSAINDYFRRSNQLTRIQHEGEKIVDKVLNITNRDIEEAVLHGAKNFEEVQKETKVATGDQKCLEEAKQLTEFYLEKYFG